MSKDPEQVTISRSALLALLVAGRFSRSLAQVQAEKGHPFVQPDRWASLDCAIGEAEDVLGVPHLAEWARR